MGSASLPSPRPRKKVPRAVWAVLPCKLRHRSSWREPRTQHTHCGARMPGRVSHQLGSQHF